MYAPSTYVSSVRPEKFFEGRTLSGPELARGIARSIRDNWRDELRRKGLGGAELNACASTFKHERMDATLGM
jgi:serine/threonine-protein kinase HipA